MKVNCPNCGAGYSVDSHKIPESGGRLTCPSCAKQWSIFPPASGSAAAGPAGETQPARGAASAKTLSQPVPVVAAPRATQVSCPKCGHQFTPRAGRRSPRPASGDRKTILLVEDHPYFTEVAREALGPDYRTVSVGTKDEALKVIQAEPPALMILDLSLASGQDGRDLLREIPSKQFPILIFTAQDETTLYGDPWEELKALGADGIVLKTMNVGEELKRKVGDLLEPE